MPEPNRIVILGGHGKVALLAAPLLASAGFTVDSVIRDLAQVPDIGLVGANPVVLDIEHASTAELAALFAGAAAVVFSAGAGGGNPARTRAVDFEAASRAIAAAEQSGVNRFVMVSYAGSGSDLQRLDPADSFYTYAKAKADADEVLRKSTLDYTILGPGMLTLEPATGKVDLAGTPGAGSHTSRANVAAVIAHVLTTNTAIGQRVDFFDGKTPIADAIN